jgi:ligand-binding sensor domain-containing protein
MVSAIHSRTQLLFRLFWPLLLLLSLSAPLVSQINVDACRRYTANEGLPSSEVYDILQDREGFIWFSTDNGVSRFNGYEFQNFGAVQGLEEPVIFYLQEDTRGRIWMQSLVGTLYYFEKDSIYSFPGNRVLDSLGTKGVSEFPFYVDSLDRVYVSHQVYGLIRFSPQGEGEWLVNGDYGKSIYEVENRAIMVFSEALNQSDSSLIDEVLWLKKRLFPLDLYLKEGVFHYELPRDKYPIQTTVFKLADGSILLQIYDVLWCFQAGKVRWTIPYPEAVLHWFQNSEGEIFTGLINRGGLRRYKGIGDIPKGRYDTFFEGYSISHMIEDADGGFWFASTDAGVFYQPKTAIKIYNQQSGFPIDYVSSLAVKTNYEVFVGFEGGNVIALNTKTNHISALSSQQSRVSSLAFDPLSERLWATMNYMLYYFHKEEWHPVLFGPDSIALGAKKLHICPEQKILWATNSGGFNKVLLENNAIILGSRSSFYQNQKLYNNRTMDAITTADNRTFVAFLDGVYELDGTKLLPANTGHPAFLSRIEAMEELPDSTIILGSKGYGLVFWKGDQIATITEPEHLTANMIENLHVDENGQIWAGTLNGLNKVVWSWGSRPIVTNYTTFHGFPSNEITDITTSGNQVYVGTTKGLVSFKDFKPQARSPKPIFATILASGRRLAVDTPARLKFKENNLTIHFYSLNYKMNGQIPYRYRMDSGEWTETKTTTVSFPSLSSGYRVFEIQSQNENGLWSGSSIFEFQIFPPWWASWWARSLALVFLLSGVVGIYKYRTRQLKRENAMLRQMTDLEKSALQAQMNPHFIFNCLSAIQNFILQNEKNKAIEYLGNFANLVRGVLNASVSGKVSLEDELKLLENYLSLEQLRFNKRFTYKIDIGASVNTYEIEIPPLLIQPYVENAILHGLSGKKSGGKIAVSFQEENDHLIVQILDNGKGINPSKVDVHPKGHKSVGMTITRRRLELFGGETKENGVKIQPLVDENGKTCGTEVIIRIGIISNRIDNKIIV